MGLKEILFKKQDKKNQQFKEFIEQILDKSGNQEDSLKNYISEQIIKQNSDLIVQFLKSNEQYTRFINQNRLEITNVVEKFTEQIEQQINESVKQISDITKQNKEQYSEIISQYRLQYRRQFKDTVNRFIVTSNEQMAKFLTRSLSQTKLESAKLLEQISEKGNAQFSKFIEQISGTINTQNSVLVKQNTELIKQISEQTAQNHGTINKKFKELAMYQVLSTFREDLITIKINIMILEKLDNSKLRILHKLYLQYQRNQPSISVLDIPRGMIIIKILFPPFFTQMLKNLTFLKSQFNDKTYAEMAWSIKEYELFFKMFNKTPDRLNKMKNMLDLGIATSDKILTKLVSID